MKTITDKELLEIFDFANAHAEHKAALFEKDKGAKNLAIHYREMEKLSGRALAEIRAKIKADSAAEAAGDFRCRGCGRPECDCSRSPCADVIEDRKATL